MADRENPPSDGSRRGIPFKETALVLAAAALLQACTSAGSPLDSASATDLTFVTAAQTWDLNKDNVVECGEWTSYLTSLFGTADADRDGAVTPEEYRAITRQDKLFEVAGMPYFDLDGDGRLTLAEFTGKPNPAFALLDKDKDCRIASSEMVQSSPAGPRPKPTFDEFGNPVTRPVR